MALSRALNTVLPCRLASCLYFPLEVITLLVFCHRGWLLYVRHKRSDLLLLHLISDTINNAPSEPEPALIRCVVVCMYGCIYTRCPSDDLLRV